MRNIKLTIEYDGTHFKGWQIQGQNHRSVQEEIKKALTKILQEDVTVIGAGRTDSGVHAQGQVAHFHTKTKKPCDEIKRALNAHLPNDVSIVDAKEVPLKFHAQFSAKNKIYRYTILNRNERSALHNKSSLFYPHKLNLSLMRAEAKELIGRHDFKSFEAADPDPKKRGDTIRTIKKCSIIKKGDFIFIDVQANGFLYKMVRNIVGTLLEIGRGKLKKGSIKNILKQKNRAAAGATAPAHGLTLVKVDY